MATRIKKFSVDWYKDCLTAAEKDDRTKQILSAAPTLQVLANLVYSRLEQLDNHYDYDTPAWQYKLANDQGRKQEMKALLKLLTPVLEQE